MPCGFRSVLRFGETLGSDGMARRRLLEGRLDRHLRPNDSKTQGIHVEFPARTLDPQTPSKAQTWEKLVHMHTGAGP